MSYPSEETILGLHKKYAPNDRAFEIVYEHCKIVDEIAQQLITQHRLSLDKKLIHAATLLHDIGYYPLLDENGYEPEGIGIKHGIAGSEILRAEGIDEAICRVAERHTGVGLTREGILKYKLPLPPRDFIPETAEERLVTYADKLHSKAILINDPHDILGWFNTPQTYLEHARKFGEDNAAKFAQLTKNYGIPNLRELADKYSQPLK